ncbi:MAG: HD domain-containing phosphohydrolase [Gemmatimonas sp.]
MQIAHLRSGFLGTRVGRQTLRSFLIAALLPVLVVSAYGVWYVRTSLEADAMDRIERTAKAGALTLMGELATVKREFLEQRSAIATTIAHDTLTAAETARLRDGGLVLRVIPSASNANRDGEVRLLRHLSNGLLARATVQSSDLWATFDELIDVDGTSYCIFEAGTWTRVHCAASTQAPMEIALRRAAVSAAGGKGRSQDNHLLLAHRDLYLRYEFGAVEWRLVTAETRALALAPASSVTLSLVLMVALAVVSSFVFAHRQIRRSTEPLEALRDGTRRVGSGDFITPVLISSRDEYGELGVAFNRMTSSITEQISLLRRMDALDEISLRERRVEAILETALAGFREATECVLASIDLVGERAHEPATRWVISDWAPRVKRTGTTISDETRRQLLSQPRHQLQAIHLQADANRPATRLVLPLIHDEELLGALTLELQGDASRMRAGIRSARRVADRIVLGIANVRLLHRLDALSSGTLRAFAQAIDANSHWTAGHSERVTRLAMELGRKLDLSLPELSILYRGGLMHDIGKIGIPPAVLDKATHLDDTERALIERHPEIGERILRPIPAFVDALPIVRSHHERFDGTGYPDRLRGEEIPWLARVLAVADVYDALVSDRPYREGLSAKAAITMIESNVGTHFDPRVVAALLAIDIERATGRDSAAIVEPPSVAAGFSHSQPFSALTAA